MNIPDNSRAVEVRESQGAQVGSHNTQNITYNYAMPAGPMRLTMRLRGTGRSGQRAWSSGKCRSGRQHSSPDRA